MKGCCRVCGDRRVRAHGRCPTCAQFLRRNGHDRTFEHIRRLTERDIARDRSRR